MLPSQNLRSSNLSIDALFFTSHKFICIEFDFSDHGLFYLHKISHISTAYWWKGVCYSVNLLYLKKLRSASHNPRAIIKLESKLLKLQVKVVCRKVTSKGLSPEVSSLPCFQKNLSCYQLVIDLGGRKIPWKENR